MKKITDEMLNDYIDNQLDVSTINELKNSLNEDEESLKKLRALKTVDEALHDIEVYPAPRNFTERVMEKLYMQVKAVKPKSNYFFTAIISIFGAIITAVLIVAWNFADKQESSNVGVNTFEAVKKFANEYFTLFGSFLHNNQLVFAGGFLTIILFFSLIYVFDSHKSFKNRLKSISH